MYLRYPKCFQQCSKTDKSVLFPGKGVFHLAVCKWHHIPFITFSSKKALSGVPHNSTTHPLYYTTHPLRSFPELNQVVLVPKPNQTASLSRAYHVAGVSCSTVCPQIDLLASSCYKFKGNKGKHQMIRQRMRKEFGELAYHCLRCLLMMNHIVHFHQQWWLFDNEEKTSPMIPRYFTTSSSSVFVVALRETSSSTNWKKLMCSSISTESKWLIIKMFTQPISKMRRRNKNISHI